LPLVEPISTVRDQLRTAATSLGGKSDNRKPILIAGAALAALLLILVCLAGGAFLALQTPLFGASKTSRAVVAAATSASAGIVATPAAFGTATPPTASAPTSTLAPSPATPTGTAPPPTRLAVAPAATQARGKVAYSVATGELAEQHSVWVANADGSNPQKVADTALWPSISPDGKRLAYYRMKDEGIYISNIDGGNPQKVLVGETCCVQWSRDSKHLMYVQGKLSIGDTHVKIVDPNGLNPFDLTLNPKPYNPAWSPDDTKIAYASCDTVSTNQCGIIVYDLIAKTSKMITKDGGGDPQWSPKGDKILYQAGNPNVFVVNPDGTGNKQLTFGKSHDGSPTWSSDGDFIFWRSDQDGKAWAIMVMRADGTNKRLIVDNVPPDGNRWAYESLSAGP
jgi:TolB protein